MLRKHRPFPPSHSSLEIFGIVCAEKWNSSIRLQHCLRMLIDIVCLLHLLNAQCLHLSASWRFVFAKIAWQIAKTKETLYWFSTPFVRVHDPHCWYHVRDSVNFNSLRRRGNDNQLTEKASFPFLLQHCWQPIWISIVIHMRRNLFSQSEEEKCKLIKSTWNRRQTWISLAALRVLRELMVCAQTTQHFRCLANKKKA